MTKLFLKHRFTKYNVTNSNMLKLIQFIGPFHNFLGIRTVQFIETRIIDPNKGDIRLVNVGSSNSSIYVRFLRYFFRTYSDAMLTSYENYLEKNTNEDFSIDFEKMKLSKEVFESFTHRESKKKSLGILCKNPFPNMLKHKVFNNGITHNYIISTEDKCERLQAINILKFNKENNSNVNFELFPTKILDLNTVVKEFSSFNNQQELLYLEGFGNIMHNYLIKDDPDLIPADLLIQSVTFGGEFSQSEVGEKWTNLDFIMNNYIKMFCSKVFKNDDRVHFFIVYKKRYLIKKGRDIIYEEKGVENIFDQGPHNQ